MALPTYTDYLKGEQSKRTLTPYELAQLNPPAPTASVPLQNNDGTTYVAPQGSNIDQYGRTNYDLSKPITSQQYNDLNNRTSGQVYSNSQAQGGTDIKYAGVDTELADTMRKKAELDKARGYADINEEKIKNDTLSEFQAEIDATNRIYADKLGRARVEGANRLGQVSAIQSRSGLLGSTFGAGQDTKVGEEQQQIYGSIENEKLSKINDIMFKSKVSSTERIAEKRKAKEEGLNSYITYLTNEANRKKTVPAELAAQILASGKTLDQINPLSIDEIARNQGVSVDSIKSAYNTLKKTQDEATKEADLKTRKAEAEIGKFGTDQANVTRTFEENKRQFGLNYAQKQSENDQKAKTDGLLSVSEANAAGVPYGTTKSQLINKPITANDTEKAITQIALAKKSLKNATGLADASGDTSWFTGAARALSGARPIDNLTAETNTLRTNVLTMATDPSIKKFFGPQMSNADVQLMTAAGTTLNPELQSPAQMKEELLRLEDFINRAEKAVKSGQTQVVNTPATSGQVYHGGVLYNVDANGEMTPA